MNNTIADCQVNPLPDSNPLNIAAAKRKKIEVSVETLRTPDVESVPNLEVDEKDV